MKWIGQHIYDFVSRFRNEATFEYYSNSTGLNSSRTTIINGDEIKLANSVNSVGPLIDIRNTADNNTGASINYYNSRANPADNDVILRSRYFANNDNGDSYIVGQQLWKFADVSDGAEKGFYSLSLAAHSSAGSSNFFEAEAKGSSDIDVKIGLGSSSTTTIKGDLTVSGGDISLGGTGRIQGVDTVTDATDAASKAYVDAAINSDIDLTSEVSGVLPIANGGTNSSSTTYCSLTANVSGTLPVANGGTGATSLTDNKLLTGTGTSAVTAEANATYDGTDLTLTSGTSAKPVLTLENSNTDAVAPILQFTKTATGANADEIGMINFIADDNADNPTTFAQVKAEIQDAANTSEDGQLELLIAQGGSLVNVLKANSNLGFGTILEFGDGGLLGQTLFKSTIVSFESAVSTAPIFTIENQTNDANGSNLIFIKDRNNTGGAGGTSDSDGLGIITFRGFDSGGGVTDYAEFAGTAVETDASNEAGKAQITVISDGQATQRNVITGTGHTTTDKVDIDLGYGSASTVTVPGFISIGGHTINDIDVAGEFVDSDEHLMTAAAIDDRIAAAGGSVSVSDSNADTHFPIVFHDESNNLHDDTGAFTYNPNAAALRAPGSVQVGTTIELGHASDTTLARSAAGKVTIEGNQIVTAGAVSVASEAQAPISTMVARRTITQAEANNMHSTPIEIVPAQGANTVIIPLGGMVRIDRATTQSQSACDWNMHYADQEPGTYGTASIQHIRRFMYNETGDRIFHITPGIASTEVAQSLTEDTNKAVEVSFDSAATTNAFTGIDVYLTYYVIQIS